MKVIDLIIKQYNNEDMPKHIKINRLNYTYNNNRKTYESEYGEFMSFDFTNNVLNMEVKLIEDEPIDIDNIEEVNHYNVISTVKGRTEENINDELELYSLTINELVQAVKQLNKEIKSIKENKAYVK